LSQVDNNIFKNTKLLHVSDLPDPLSGSTIIVVVDGPGRPKTCKSSVLLKILL
jgi:hypothetical protein